MMREASELSADQVILDGYGWDDLERSTFNGYRRRFQTAHPDSPHNSLDDEAFLVAIGGFRRDRATGQRGFTVAGLLMFGTVEAIRSWRGRHLIDYRVLARGMSLEDNGDWADRLAWEGNLLGAFEALSRRLVEDLPVPFVISDGVRSDSGEEQIAIREALVNLLLHADYREQDASLIVRSSVGFLFRNPGNSRIADLDPAAGDRSDPRNPELVRMFRLIGLAEEAGTGVPRIVRAWRRLGYEAPQFDLGGERYEFAARLRLTHLLSAEDRAWLAALDGPLPQEEQIALVIARHEGAVDNARLRQVTAQHPVDVTRVLGGLRDSGFLQMIGGGRGARYRLDPSLLAIVPVKSVDIESTGGNWRGRTKPVEASTADSVESTAGFEHDTLDLPPTLVDDPIWPQLESIAMPVSSVDYIDAARRNEVVVRLCQVRALSLLELSWLLGRNKAYVRSILSELVRGQRLEYVYPDRPRHPQQRYKAAGRR
jgi:predicted HTH transcriptional regulator